jgi:hypothetical protein
LLVENSPKIKIREKEREGGQEEGSEVEVGEEVAKLY